MKRILIAAVSLAALGAAGSAFAAPSHQTIHIRARNPAQCNITASTNVVTLPTNSMSDATGHVQTSLATSVATALNGAGVYAWCTGSHNGVNLSRTALITGAGATNNGFAEGAIYDIAINIGSGVGGATRYDAVTPLEGSSDGIGNGPGVGAGSYTSVTSFGPAGPGELVTFLAEGSGNVNAVTNGLAGGQGPTSGFTTTTNRLLAGPYHGTATVTLTPGV
jgi:hypothetical protein